MSGHSKFSNIKHKKAAQDKLRAKAFVKITKSITIAVKKAGPDPATNPALRLCISKARAENMPKSNYMKAIERASNPHNNTNYEAFMYEGYTKGGVAIMVECLSDNRNRTGANIKSIFKSYGASLGGANSVAYYFQRTGIIEFTHADLNLEDLIEQLLEFNLRDVTYDAETNIGHILVDPKELKAVQNEIINRNIVDIIEVSNKFIPNNTTSLKDEDLNKLEKLIQALDNDEDVDQVYHNCSNLK